MLPGFVVVLLLDLLEGLSHLLLEFVVEELVRLSPGRRLLGERGHGRLKDPLVDNFDVSRVAYKSGKLGRVA